jgi:hypothetical protein
MPNIINERREQVQFEALRKLREAYRTVSHRPLEQWETASLALRDAISAVLALGLPAPSAQSTGKCIVLSGYEVQSGLNRVEWAENLIRQLLNTTGGQHDGAASWLLNHGGDKTVVTDLPAPSGTCSNGSGETSGICSNGSGETIDEELPYRRAVQLTAYSPNEATMGFYAAVAGDGTMWLLPWGRSKWMQLPCLPAGAIDL